LGKAKLVDRLLDADSRVELGQARLERVAERLALLGLECLAHDISDARVLTSAHALIGERAQIIGKVDRRGARHRAPKS